MILVIEPYPNLATYPLEQRSTKRLLIIKPKMLIIVEERAASGKIILLQARLVIHQKSLF